MSSLPSDFITEDGGGGTIRVWGCLERNFDKFPVGDKKCCSGVMGRGQIDDPPLVPREAWIKEGVSVKHRLLKNLNQRQTSHCHSYAGTKLFMACRLAQGFADVDFSPGSLAGQVTGYRDEGAEIAAVMQVLLASGPCLLSEVPFASYDGRDWPNDWKEKAALNRLLRAWDCGHKTVFDGIVSNIHNGNPVELGTNAFGGGHAVVALWYRLVNGVWILGGDNSWAPEWTNCNVPGSWEFTERQLTNLNVFGAFGGEAAIRRPDDMHPMVAAAQTTMFIRPWEMAGIETNVA